MIKAGDIVTITDEQGRVSDPVEVVSVWGEDGEATVRPAAHGFRYWNVEDMTPVST